MRSSTSAERQCWTENEVWRASSRSILPDRTASPSEVRLSEGGDRRYGTLAEVFIHVGRTDNIISLHAVCYNSGFCSSPISMLVVHVSSLSGVLFFNFLGLIMESLPINVHVSRHPCLRAKLSKLRSQSTDAQDTKRLIHEIALIVGIEALATLAVSQDGSVSSPPVLNFCADLRCRLTYLDAYNRINHIWDLTSPSRQ